MAVARSGLDDGYGRVLHAMLDEPRTATWDEYVNKTGEAHELIGCLATRILDALDAIGR